MHNNSYAERFVNLTGMHQETRLILNPDYIVQIIPFEKGTRIWILGKDDCFEVSENLSALQEKIRSAYAYRPRTVVFGGCHD